MSHTKGNRVEIVTNGWGKVIYVDGVQLEQVTDFELPTDPNEVAQQVRMTIVAREIVQRKVSSEEWARLMARTSNKTD